MNNYELLADEVILYEGTATSKSYKGNLKVTLTSRKLVIEKEKGLFKTEYVFVDAIPLETIKLYNGIAQIKQKSNNVDIQTAEKNICLALSGVREAGKFSGKLVDATTGSTLGKRSMEKVKDAINLVDDTLGIDTRGTIKSLLENGVKGTMINGISMKK